MTDVGHDAVAVFFTQFVVGIAHHLCKPRNDVQWCAYLVTDVLHKCRLHAVRLLGMLQRFCQACLHTMAHHDVDEEQEDDCRHNCESGDMLLAHVSLVLSGHLQFLLVHSSLFASFGAARECDGRVEPLGDADAHGAGSV